MRRRLDTELVRRGLMTSREHAVEAIALGRVRVAGAIAEKASRQVDAAEPIELAGPRARFVSRGGEKLAGALERFAIDPSGLTVLDVGASTGGFTDCLLQFGAARVVAVDVGHGQLHERIRLDVRVEVLERTNIRNLGPERLDGRRFPLVVADLSFISLTTVASAVVGLTAEHGTIIALIKPQFEAGRVEVSRGRGVITDPSLWRRAVEQVRDAFAAAGAVMMDVMESPIRGAEGNVEFLARFVHAEPASDGQTVDLSARLAAIGGTGEGSTYVGLRCPTA